MCRYATAEDALPHIQAIVLQEQEAASARASRGEVDAAADGDADNTASASSDDTAVNVRTSWNIILVLFMRLRRSLRWLSL